MEGKVEKRPNHWWFALNLAVLLDKRQAGTIVEMIGRILTFILTLPLSGNVNVLKR